MAFVVVIIYYFILKALIPERSIMLIFFWVGCFLLGWFLDSIWKKIKGVKE